MENSIRNPKKPSPTDLKILSFMDEGNRIDNVKALRLFNVTGLRDVLYRLRCAGHEIKHQDIVYKTKTGESKMFREWFTTDYKILPTQEKTDKNKKQFFQPEIF